MFWMRRRWWLVVLASVAALCGFPLQAGRLSAGELKLVVNDDQGRPLPCRIHVWDESGVAQRVSDLPFWYDHFVIPGEAVLSLKAGRFRYLIERGPEYQRLRGEVVVDENGPHVVNATLHRLTELRTQGWFAADLHVHRPLEQAPMLMAAEDLDLAPIISWWNARNAWSNRDLPQEVWHRTPTGRFLSLTAGEDEREGGALLYFGLNEPIDIRSANREYPSPLVYVQQAHRQNPEVWIDIEKPFWWDVPVWLASGKMQSIGIANNHMCRDQMLENEAWGRPRDTARLPSPLGNGMWSQEIYYHILNAGIRLPPSAGSASGVLPNPVGYNRVYVHLDEPLTPNAWFQGLRRGACFVTNGPLLICSANQHRPGAELQPDAQGQWQIDLSVDVVSRDTLRALEVVHNGVVIQRLDEGLRDNRLSLHKHLTLNASGWFLVRALGQNTETFRFASTGPFYLAQGQSPRTSRASAEFFLDWVDQRIDRITHTVSNQTQRDEVLEFHRQARQFWQQRLENANAD